MGENGKVSCISVSRIFNVLVTSFYNTTASFCIAFMTCFSFFVCASISQNHRDSIRVTWKHSALVIL